MRPLKGECNVYVEDTDKMLKYWRTTTFLLLGYLPCSAVQLIRVILYIMKELSNCSTVDASPVILTSYSDRTVWYCGKNFSEWFKAWCILNGITFGLGFLIFLKTIVAELKSFHVIEGKNMPNERPTFFYAVLQIKSRS